MSDTNLKDHLVIELTSGVDVRLLRSSMSDELKEAIRSISNGMLENALSGRRFMFDSGTLLLFMLGYRAGQDALKESGNE